jgi:DNA-binding CsgD family transcriptional regulator
MSISHQSAEGGLRKTSRPALAYGSETFDRIARSREAAFATDSADRIILWNRTCEALLARPARNALGRRCYEVIGGFDVYGNIYCHRGCPVAFQARERPKQPVHRFSLSIEVAGKGLRKFDYSLFAIPSYHPALSALIHVLRERKKESELERRLAREAEVREPLWPITTSAERSVDLTERETEILRCLSRGMATAAIGRKLFISTSTVRNHIQHILEKLDVHNKLGALIFAYQHKLIEPDDSW